MTPQVKSLNLFSRFGIYVIVDIQLFWEDILHACCMLSIKSWLKLGGGGNIKSWLKCENLLLFGARNWRDNFIMCQPLVTKRWSDCYFVKDISGKK